MGTAGMILGIIGVVFAFIPLVGPFVSIPCIAIGLPLSIIGFFLNLRRNQGKGMSIAGIVCNGIALALTVISIVITVTAVNEITESLSEDSSARPSAPRSTTNRSPTGIPSSATLPSSTTVVAIASGSNPAEAPRTSAPGILVATSMPNPTVATVDQSQTKEAQEVRDLGIGVAFEKFEHDFGGDMGFEFEDSPLADGRSRKLGRSPDGVATLELIGPESNLTQVTLVLGLDSAKSDFLALYTMTAFAAVTPDWLEEGLKWVNDSMESLQRMGPEANDSFSTQQGNIKIALTAVPYLPIVLLNFVSQDTSLAAILPTPPPTPPVWDPSRWETDEYEAHKMLNSKRGVLWAGAAGNGGLEPGRYEYRDTNGGEIVNESGCYLEVNRGTSEQQRVHLVEGSTFSVTLGPIHGYVSFGGYKDSSCHGSLYRMGVMGS